MEKIFRTEFAQSVFTNKYAHENAQSWTELSNTLVEDVCRDFITNDEKTDLKKLHSEMKFIAGGRYLYYAGRSNKFFNNCFSGDTKLVTDKGLYSLKDLEGQIVNVLSPVTGEFLPAMINNHGKQKLRELTFKSLRGKSNLTYKIKATRNHHWLLINGKDTYDLRLNDVVPANAFSCEEDKIGYLHGLVFGDGSLEYISKKGEFKHVNKIRLCGNKSLLLNDIIEILEQNKIKYTLNYPESYNNDPLIRIWRSYSFKDLPLNNNSASYKAGFIRGWLAMDGSEISGGLLGSVNEDYINWFIENACLAGIVISGNKRSQIRNTQYKDNHTIFIVNYSYGKNFQGFKLVDIKELEEDYVYCPFEPIHNRIVIENNIDTFNCYLLKSEEDSREDWANLSWKAENCLMTGGGIGNDYSIYRPEGSLISRTGGFASGPISKMSMINEIGKFVMQGASRRSAIYASLNWKHQDAGKFLIVKDWGEKLAPGTNLTYKQLKEKDFNASAPLDITNISLNYDNNFLSEISNDDLQTTFYKYLEKNTVLNLKNQLPEIFIQNVYFAMKNGEPGFSFNFFDKEKETLRNACCEVSSEDDSDVCNLGSLNMANYETIEEWKAGVILATKFLLCGTLVAHLPYQKVYETREKNRRLGLGLMGVHEWLLKRGYKYEVVPELHEWLQVYEDYSTLTAIQLADKLGISRPVATRSIAPTGSIGILAGTTTGIEPLYAVAYKRRYLKGSNQWHYQYVIDGTAKILINKYDLNPDEIETAVDLSNDIERRIKFQADIQDYVDMAISSTLNVPSWGFEKNNEDTVHDVARSLAKYSHRLRGFTCYPDGARGGQPLTSVSYSEALKHEGAEYMEEFNDICTIAGKGGACGN